jgi:type I restriction enzyme S subunit
MNQHGLLEDASETAKPVPAVKRHPYPRYAPSTSPWLGDLPAHWATRRLKFVANSRPSNVDKKTVEGEITVRLCNYVDVYKNDYITPDLDFMQATADSAELAKFRLRRGDVLITKDSEEWNDIAVPAFVTQNFDDVACGYHLSQVRPRANVMDGEYLFRAFRANGVSEQFQVAANGVTRFGIAAGAIGDVMFPVPPLDEQQAIAAFLRREAARIDSLVAKKQRLIELLQEKRTALIGHVVTKGLDPNAPMKPSGIDWLGPIPEHWLVKKLRYLCSIRTGDKDTVDAIEDGEYPFFVRSQNVERIASYTFDCEGVLTAGDGVGVGKVFHHYSGKFDVHQRVYVMTRFQGVTGRFLYYFLKEQFYKVALEGNAKSTVDSLRRPMFTAFPVSVAPLEEQKAIVKCLDAEVAGLDRLVSSVVTAIERLREYRSALISAAVTGKIDVRNCREDTPCQ